MEAFSNMFDDASCDIPFEGFIDGDKNILNLLYIDDLLVFGKAKVDNAEKLKDILEQFTLCSSLFINQSESSTIFLMVLLLQLIYAML